MIKYEYGWISDTNGANKTPVIVKSALPCKASDLAISIGLMGLGITYLTISAFKHGARCHEKAEFDVLEKIGLLH